MFYGLAEYQEYYAKRISVFIALASITLAEHTTGQLASIADNYDAYDNTMTLLNKHEIMAGKSYWWDLEYKGESIVSSNPVWDDEDRFFVYQNHSPSGASLRCIELFAQNIKMNRF